MSLSVSTNINKLAAEIEAAKKAAETRELMEGAKKKKKTGEIEVESGGGDVVEEGKRIQTKSALAMDRTAKLVNDMEEMGAETNLQLKSQSEQIKTTHSDVDAINEGMTRASKQVRDIGRRLATGKGRRGKEEKEELGGGGGETFRCVPCPF